MSRTIRDKTPRIAGKTDAKRGEFGSKDGTHSAMKFSLRRIVLASLFASLPFVSSNSLFAQQGQADATQAPAQLNEPVFRVAKGQTQAEVPVNPHPLDPALNVARESLTLVESNVHDYTALLVKRERVGDVLGENEYMRAKIRNRKVQNGQIVVPFSVYLAFLKPTTVKGREVLFVENANQGKLFAHEGGMKRMLGTHTLEPNGWLAMQGQRYPITDIGITNLVTKLIERGERDKRVGLCGVQFFEGAKVSGRECTVIQVEHPEQKAPYDFHIAQVFMDNEYRIPVRYAAYTWPKTPGGEPEVLEEYTYQDIKFNVGLKDSDFDPNNSEYAFAKK
jgi:Protein of unknown function (DUF1571)